nr:hypothetical protein [Candidatus Njordarchaeota archaeon]
MFQSFLTELCKSVPKILLSRSSAFRISDWGVTISEVESEEASATSANMWRIAKPGMFKVFKGTIGMKLEDILPIAMKLAKQIKGK